MNITASKEDYLKAILHLKEKNGYVRATDVAEALSVKKPSVSIAFGKLAADDLITVHENHQVDLTKAGYDIAAKINHSYETVKQFLCSIGVPEKVAEHDACRVEHYLSQESVVSIGGLVGEKTKNRQGEDTGQIDAGQKSEKRGGTQHGEKQYGGK